MNMNQKIRVLIVDDSRFIIGSITRKLQTDPEIEVIGSAVNGKEAVEKVKSLTPDVVTMDVVMPEMDGLTAVRYIMAECPTPIVMLSALTSENAEITLRALELGAVDFFLKPSTVSPVADGSIVTLIEKIKTASQAHLNGRKPSPNLDANVSKIAPVSHRNKSGVNKLVVIGSSTGGPRALAQLIPSIPADFNAGILIVQHMPPIFTKSLAERLSQASKIKVTEAKDGDPITCGQALLAPGDFHMTISNYGKIALNQDPRIQGVRPSVDVTMKSAASIYGKSAIGVVLTGMGSDGTEGASRIKEAGGRIIVEDESTCAIYGMPQSVFKSGYADKKLPLPKIASELIQMCNQAKGEELAP
jgi:two-component system, chemotaxis family, protein-glutamate methylesterase/glutaminase